MKNLLQITSGTLKKQLLLEAGIITPRPLRIKAYLRLEAIQTHSKQLMTSLFHQKAQQISLKNQTLFQKLFTTSYNYMEIMNTLDDLGVYIKDTYLGSKITKGFHHILHTVIIKNPIALLIPSISNNMIHEHLKFIKENTDKNTLNYIFYGDIVLYNSYTLTMKPIFIKRNHNLKNNKLINEIFQTINQSIALKATDYGSFSYLHINKCKIITINPKNDQPNNNLKDN